MSKHEKREKCDGELVAPPPVAKRVRIGKLMLIDVLTEYKYAPRFCSFHDLRSVFCAAKSLQAVSTACKILIKAKAPKCVRCKDDMYANKADHCSCCFESEFGKSIVRLTPGTIDSMQRRKAIREARPDPIRFATHLKLFKTAVADADNTKEVNSLLEKFWIPPTGASWRFFLTWNQSCAVLDSVFQRWKIVGSGACHGNLVVDFVVLSLFAFLVLVGDELNEEPPIQSDIGPGTPCLRLHFHTFMEHEIQAVDTKSLAASLDYASKGANHFMANFKFESTIGPAVNDERLKFLRYALVNGTYSHNGNGEYVPEDLFRAAFQPLRKTLTAVIHLDDDDD